jgi:hypothetical protein
MFAWAVPHTLYKTVLSAIAVATKGIGKARFRDGSLLRWLPRWLVTADSCRDGSATAIAS